LKRNFNGGEDTQIIPFSNIMAVNKGLQALFGLAAAAAAAAAAYIRVYAHTHTHTQSPEARATTTSLLFYNPTLGVYCLCLSGC
jgi:uncharacterized membrane protein required for colicin V production